MAPPFFIAFLYDRIMKSQHQAQFVVFTLLLFILCFSSIFWDVNCSNGEEPSSGRKTSKGELSSMLDALENNPSDGKICNSMGFYYYELGEYNLAKEYYKKAVKLNKEYPISYNNLGVVYLNQNELGPAVDYFAKAIELNPQYVKAICNLAVTRFKMGDYAEAKRLYYRAKSINPEYVYERASYIKNKKRK